MRSYILICLLFAAGAAWTQDAAAPAPANFLPLAEGNQWEYSFQLNGQKVNIVNRVAKIETIDGVRMGRVETSRGAQVVANEHMVQDGRGIFRARLLGNEIVPPLQLVKYPAKPGEAWEAKFKLNNLDCEIKVKTSNEEVVVPAGKFKTFKVELDYVENGQNNQTVYWFVNDLGFVKQRVRAGALDLNLELEKFTPGKK